MNSRRLRILLLVVLVTAGACSSSELATESSDADDPDPATSSSTTEAGPTTTIPIPTTSTTSAPTTTATPTTAAPPDAAPFPADSYGDYWFQSPSGNIGCHLAVGHGVRCDILERSYSAPATPPDCPLDFGNVFWVAADGGAEMLCYSDTVYDPNAPVLGYGESVMAGGVECSSAESGMTCRSLGTEHGFTVRRAGYDLF